MSGGPSGHWLHAPCGSRLNLRKGFQLNGHHLARVILQQAQPCIRAGLRKSVQPFNLTTGNKVLLQWMFLALDAKNKWNRLYSAN